MTLSDEEKAAVRTALEANSALNAAIHKLYSLGFSVKLDLDSISRFGERFPTPRNRLDIRKMVRPNDYK